MPAAHRKAAILAFASSLLLPFQTVLAQQAECQRCHEDVTHETSVHAELECVDCHPAAKQLAHRRGGIEQLAGDELCETCHDATQELHASVHGALSCQDCHGSAHEITRPEEDLCADCHRRDARAVSRSIHGKVASCQDCHGEGHGIRSSDDLTAQVSRVNQIRSCGRCHDSPPELIQGYLGSVHSRALLVSGLLSAPACTSCHGSHDIQASSSADSSISEGNVPETCGACHVLILNTWLTSAHGEVWKEGGDGPVCTTCHESHAITDPTAAGARLAFPEDCGGCHGALYSSFRDSFHGQVTNLGFAAGAICSDCHTPHANLPANDPASSIHPENLSQTCGRCHGVVTASFLTFDPHSDPTDPARSPEVFYVWLFMTGLLLAVFGFFGVHDLLWLQRSLVGLLRGEHGSRPVADGPHIRRFSSVTIRVHVVIVVTFLLLAATGLPLKFHWTAWAQSLIGLFGGVQSARLIHRLAAIATFGYALFHLGHIFVRAMLRRERGLFWGFASLVPQPKDIVDLLRNLRYFLYLGERPRGDRWGYWEKFDYMAVFWGVPIIGVSGLMLWFPNFFSSFLPGWALNAAHVVHSDEALLATGFIFVFHFFHTHLRPESFPMDPVIFTGKLPLARFKEERPLEYQRLLDSGELDQRIVDAPTAAELARARLFGFTSVVIGLVLAVAIFWSILGPLLG